MPGQKPTRLPPLKTLRVHQPKKSVENPCISIMTTVLGMPLPPDLQLRYVRFDNQKKLTSCELACWASAGYNAAGCMAIENQLRQCMDGPPAPKPKPNTVNYHLSRMQKYVTARQKHGRRL